LLIFLKVIVKVYFAMLITRDQPIIAFAADTNISAIHD